MDTYEFRKGSLINILYPYTFILLFHAYYWWWSLVLWWFNYPGKLLDCQSFLGVEPRLFFSTVGGLSLPIET